MCVPLAVPILFHLNTLPRTNREPPASSSAHRRRMSNPVEWTALDWRMYQNDPRLFPSLRRSHPKCSQYTIGITPCTQDAPPPQQQRALHGLPNTSRRRHTRRPPKHILSLRRAPPLARGSSMCILKEVETTQCSMRRVAYLNTADMCMRGS